MESCPRAACRSSNCHCCVKEDRKCLWKDTQEKSNSDTSGKNGVGGSEIIYVCMPFVFVNLEICGSVLYVKKKVQQCKAISWWKSAFYTTLKPTDVITGPNNPIYSHNSEALKKPNI